MASDAEKTNKRWSDYTERFDCGKTGLFWWEVGPEYHRYVNTKVSGDPHVDWIDHTLRARFAGKLPLNRCLSLGCGSGVLERTLSQRDAFRHCDAYDVAEGSVQRAKELAGVYGIDSISYHVADIDSMLLPSNAYDAVWIQSAMHHFHKLERVCAQIRQSLQPNGLFILNDYVGPSRFQFPPRQKELIVQRYQSIPPEYRAPVSVPDQPGGNSVFSRLVRKIKERDLLNSIRRRTAVWKRGIGKPESASPTVHFPTAKEIEETDPSEAVRSEEIVDVLQTEFEIVERKGWGGNIMQFLLAGIAGNFREDDKKAQDMLRDMFDYEDAALSRGELQSDFCYIVARPKKV